MDNQSKDYFQSLFKVLFSGKTRLTRSEAEVLNLGVQFLLSNAIATYSGLGYRDQLIRLVKRQGYLKAETKFGLIRQILKNNILN